jgi:hypothetical protein
MKVLKPQKLGIISRCFEHGRRFYMGVSALAMYPLGRTDTLSHEIPMWKLAAERLGAEGALDVGIPKSRGEFLVNGIAFAPGGVPHPMVPVRARGPWRSLLEGPDADGARALHADADRLGARVRR